MMKKGRASGLFMTLLFSSCLVFLFFLGACSQTRIDPVKREFFAMDTLMELTVYGEGAEKAADAAIKRISEIEALCSRYLPDSEVSKINESAGITPAAVSGELLEIIKNAVYCGRITNGAFDISIGPLTELWGIGTGEERIPSQEEIREALKLVGYEKIVIDEGSGSIFLPEEGMSIDLGGIAKGYAIDEVLKVFESHGIGSALINLGGSSIYALGTKPDGEAWTVALRHPRSEAEYLCVLKLSGMALSTSGDYERSFMADGKRYHHILDPKTGYPADAGLISVTVTVGAELENRGLLSDALTKAAFVSGTEKGFEITDGLSGVACLAVREDGALERSEGWALELLSP